MWESEISAAGRRYQVPEAWIRAVIETESAWNPRAYNPSDPTGAWGLMQLLYRTAQNLGYTGAPEGLFDPAINIDLGTKLLGQLRRSYGDDFRRVYSAYNSGRPDLWQTSSQVAANVGRALENLEKWITEEVAALTASPAGAGAIGLLIAFVLLWAWGGHRKKK